MSLDLSRYVSGGEIINYRNNSVHGYLALYGSDRPIVLQLTGNCGEELAGRHLRFQVSTPLTIDESILESEIGELHFSWMQIGVPGEMRIKREPSGLSLEWFGQQGRIVVELTDSLLEFVEEDEAQIAAEAEQALADADAEDDMEDDVPGTGSQIASFERTDDVEGESWNPDDEQNQDDEEDPFGLFPPDLNASLGVSATPWNSEPDETTLAQWKEWDEVFDGTKDVPLSSLFDPPIQLPPTESLDDEQVGKLFNTILMQLARHNVAFHMCEHFTPRSGYRLLVEEILREYGTHPELPRIGYTMNFDTSEHCDQCADEFERRYADREANRNQDETDLDPSDEDMPF